MNFVLRKGEKNLSSLREDPMGNGVELV